MKHFLLFLIAATLSLTLPAHADGEACKRPVNKHFTAADSDNDGTVDKAESRAMADKHFDEMDTDHDGKLTKEEMMMGKRHMKKQEQ
jgi:Ca2+-binding EF-hand superfamily protein